MILLSILCLLLTTPAQAAQQQGILYKFQKPGGEIHYLFGTMHATDPRIIDVLEIMIKAYTARDLVKLQQLTLEYELSSSDRALANWFRQELIVNRNIRMAKRLASLLDNGSSFVAVGALHLVEDSGLIQALKRTGYQVESIY